MTDTSVDIPQRPRGGGQIAHVPYTPRRFERSWDHFRQFTRKRETPPEGHYAFGRVDVTDRQGRVLKQHYVSAPAMRDLNAPGGPREELYARTFAEFDRSEVYVFFNNLSTEGT